MDLLISLIQGLLQALYEEGLIRALRRDGSGDWVIVFSNGKRYRLTSWPEEN